MDRRPFPIVELILNGRRWADPQQNRLSQTCCRYSQFSGFRLLWNRYRSRNTPEFKPRRSHSLSPDAVGGLLWLFVLQLVRLFNSRGDAKKRKELSPGSRHIWNPSLRRFCRCLPYARNIPSGSLRRIGRRTHCNRCKNSKQVDQMRDLAHPMSS